MPTSKKTKVSTKSKTKKNLRGSGKGFFKSVFKSTVPAIYRNVRYTKHNTDFPGITLLTCLMCKRNIFKMHRMKIATYGKGIFLGGNFFGANFWNDSYNYFKCVDCGYTMVFSNDITYQEDTNVKELKGKELPREKY
jgi:hypothetical protein